MQGLKKDEKFTSFTPVSNGVFLGITNQMNLYQVEPHNRLKAEYIITPVKYMSRVEEEVSDENDSKRA